jgi:CDP-paratose 2-epimerase
MRLLITGICGFAGSSITRAWLVAHPGIEICGIDNLSRAGSEINRLALQKLGVKVYHGDIRMAADFEALPPVDWVIDAAANPSVLAGVDGQCSSRQLLEHNLFGTVNTLEYCKCHRAGFILLSTSRVYSIKPLAEAPVKISGERFALTPDRPLPAGLTANGVNEAFSTAPPLSLYGSTKIASEQLALEYGETFGFPVWINRCGVLAGAGQFGKIDQGILAFWINSWLRKKPLAYIGFGGHGHQVRDCLHPTDLVQLLQQQATGDTTASSRIVNLGGGSANSFSLAELGSWCRNRFGEHEVTSVADVRRFDIPWLVMDSSLAAEIWGWQPQIPLSAILEEIACHAEQNPHWLELSEGA